MSLRDDLKAGLAPLLPQKPRWLIVPGIDAPDRITKPTIVIEQKQVEPAPGAKGLYEIGMSFHVITPKAGVGSAAEDDIDALVLDALAALDRLGYLSVGVATKRVYNDTNLSYEIETTILTQKTKE